MEDARGLVPRAITEMMGKQEGDLRIYLSLPKNCMVEASFFRVFADSGQKKESPGNPAKLAVSSLRSGKTGL